MPKPLEDVLEQGRAAGREAAAPEALRVHADHVELADGRVACSLLVRGYPREVGPGWLAVLEELGGEYRHARHIEPLDSLEALSTLTRHLRQLRASQLMAEARGAEGDALDRSAADDAERLRQALAAGEVRLFRHHLVLTIFGPSPEVLRRRCAEVTALLAGHLLTARRALLEEGPAFAATLPVGHLTVRCGRNLDSDALAAAPPVGGIAAAAGEVWGIDVRGRTVVQVDRFSLPNPHALCLAGSGAGKSFSVKHLLAQAVLGGHRVAIVDPQGEYGAWCRMMGGRYLRLTPGGEFRLNPLAKPWSLSEEAWRGVRAERVLELLLMLGERPQPDRVAEAVERAARAATPGDPTLSGVAAYLSSSGGRLATAMRGALAPFAGHGSIDRSDLPLVFDLQDVMGEPPPVVASVLLLLTRHVVDQLVDPARAPLTVAIDEAHHLLRDVTGAKFVETLFRTGRKRGAAILLATQSAGDLLSADSRPEAARAARAALANAAVVFLMRQQTAQEVALLTSLYRLGEAESEWLRRCPPGEGLLIAGDRRALVRVDVPPALHEAFSTTPTRPPAGPRGP